MYSQEEDHLNGTSKVRVSYSKYRMVPENVIWDDSDEDEDEYFTQVHLFYLIVLLPMPVLNENKSHVCIMSNQSTIRRRDAIYFRQ